jgi:hypothetical protein
MGVDTTVSELPEYSQTQYEVNLLRHEVNLLRHEVNLLRHQRDRALAMLARTEKEREEIRKELAESMEGDVSLISDYADIRTAHIQSLAEIEMRDREIANLAKQLESERECRQSKLVIIEEQQLNAKQAERIAGLLGTIKAAVESLGRVREFYSKTGLPFSFPATCESVRQILKAELGRKVGAEILRRRDLIDPPVNLKSDRLKLSVDWARDGEDESVFLVTATLDNNTTRVLATGSFPADALTVSEESRNPITGNPAGTDTEMVRLPDGVLVQECHDKESHR